mgnify:CR=1 FL=1
MIEEDELCQIEKHVATVELRMSEGDHPLAYVHLRLLMQTVRASGFPTDRKLRVQV